MRYYEGVLKDLVYQFFFKFSRFEFALKEKGHVRAGAHESAMPNWNSFINNYEQNYTLSGFETELINSPPKVQRLGNNFTEWKDIEFRNNQSELLKITLLLRAMRNNLFHGGKHGENEWDDPARITFLLENGCQCIDKMSKLDGDLRAHYLDEY